ncbi:SIS domain-containing protein [Curtobacterium sp. MCBD17_035]|uniref:SIS domain-containing protein n=1 Tax=Curtobacterium sp. MCBD17_035 TaxID=2175673 RepID=UPI0015E8A3FE|nr:SIS domain-containing protein [Curtobacterium sp. MCBD17_035]WIB68973.1 SIS domain-containing protein [Curtobacterium sp. MCBD17_035]
MTTTPPSPFIGQDSPLDARQQQIVERVSAAEHASIVALPTDHPLDPKRRARDEATYPELIAQPDRIRETLAANDAALDELADRIAAMDVDRVFVTGAGDSLAVAIAARQTLELMLGVPVEPVQSLDLAYYLAPLVTTRSVVVALSSSGETTRTVEAALVAQHIGALTVAITNTAGSTLDTESERTLLLRATRVGWPTQSSTTALALLVDLAIRVGALRGHAAAPALRQALDTVPALMERVIAETEPRLRAIAQREQAADAFLFSAAGPSWGAAIIGAAKVKECTPDHAEAIQVEEFHHYNSLKAGEPIWVIAPAGPSVPRAVHTASEAKRFGGSVTVVTTEGVHDFDDVADDVVTVPAVPEPISPLLTVLPAQLTGYLLAMEQFATAEAAVAAEAGTTTTAATHA